MRARDGQESRTLPEIAIDLRGAKSGVRLASSEEIERDTTLLKNALATWELSLRQNEARFDAAVKELIEAALAEQW